MLCRDNKRKLLICPGWNHSRNIGRKKQPFTQTGRECFDGKGGMSGIYTGNLNGTIARGSYKGTYTMNSNCSGTVTFEDNQKNASRYDIYATQNGS